MRTIACALLLLAALPASPVLAHEGVAVPSHYVVRKNCTPGRGFIAIPEAPNFPPGYPMMALFVFNGEVVGFLLEVHEKDGWKPWYDQPQGQPISHGGGPKHYSQLVMIKKGPTAEECRRAKAP